MLSSPVVPELEMCASQYVSIQHEDSLEEVTCVSEIGFSSAY